MDQNKLPLGFTFSFACKQEGLSVAKLVSWSKGFQIPDMMGKDVAQLLREALIRRGVGKFSWKFFENWKTSFNIFSVF